MAKIRGRQGDRLTARSAEKTRSSFGVGAFSFAIAGT
jgi:hypothetical protein